MDAGFQQVHLFIISELFKNTVLEYQKFKIGEENQICLKKVLIPVHYRNCIGQAHSFSHEINFAVNRMKAHVQKRQMVSGKILSITNHVFLCVFFFFFVCFFFFFFCPLE